MAGGAAPTTAGGTCGRVCGGQWVGRLAQGRTPAPGAPPLRVRRVGAEPGPRQVVPGGLAGWWRWGRGAERRGERPLASGSGHRLREQVAATEVARSPPGGELAGGGSGPPRPMLR